MKRRAVKRLRARQACLRHCEIDCEIGCEIGSRRSMAAGGTMGRTCVWICVCMLYVYTSYIYVCVCICVCVCVCVHVCVCVCLYVWQPEAPWAVYQRSIKSAGGGGVWNVCMCACTREASSPGARRGVAVWRARPFRQQAASYHLKDKEKSARTCIHMHACTHVHMHTCTHAHLGRRRETCIPTCMYTCIHTCMYACTPRTTQRDEARSMHVCMHT